MKTKHRILSVLVIVAIVASLFVMVAPTTSAQTPPVTVNQTPMTAGDAAGFSITLSGYTAVGAAGTITITFPPAVTMPTSIAYTNIAVNGTTLTAANGVTVSGQSVVITADAIIGALAPASVTISQSAGIKNPALAKTKASGVYNVTVSTSVPQTGTGAMGVIPSYVITPTAQARNQQVKVSGKGWAPGLSVVVGGALSSPNPATADTNGTFTDLVAYPTGIGTNVSITDGAGQTEVGPAAGVVWDALVLVTVPTLTLLPQISANPTEGSVGSSITITGFDFSPVVGNIVSLTMAGASLIGGNIALISIDANNAGDDFTTKVTVPVTVGSGVKTIVASDGIKSASTTFTVTKPTIGLSPMAGQPNTSVTVQGSGFPALDVIPANGTFPGPGLYIAGVAWNTLTITADSAGNWTATVRVPNTAALGLNGVYCRSNNGATASTAFSVSSRAVIVTPASGPIGTQVVITCSNLTPGATVPVNGLKFDGVGKNTAAITIDSVGNMSPFTLAISQADIGVRTVTVTDGTVTASGTFTITQPTIAITPTTGYKGDTITVTGSGWATGLLGLVTVKFAGAPVVLATPDASGAFTAIFTVPATALGTSLVAANDSLINTAQPKTFAIAPASITLSPTSGPVGSTVTITGKGFLPQSGLGALTIGTVPVLPATAVVTDILGAFTATFAVPGLATGAQTVTATVGGAPVTAFFTISAGGETAAYQLRTISAQLIRVWGLGATGWQMYDPSDTVGSDLGSLVPGKGYFVQVNAPCTLVYNAYSYNLTVDNDGWNLLGWR